MRCGNPACAEEASTVCSRCQAVFYCGPPCQKAHWRAHKPGCAAPAATPTPPCTGAAAAGGELCSGPLSAVLPWLRCNGYRHAHLSDHGFNLPVTQLLQLLPEQPVCVMWLSGRAVAVTPRARGRALFTATMEPVERTAGGCLIPMQPLQCPPMLAELAAALAPAAAIARVQAEGFHFFHVADNAFNLGAAAAAAMPWAALPLVATRANTFHGRRIRVFLPVGQGSTLPLCVATQALEDVHPRV